METNEKKEFINDNIIYKKTLSISAKTKERRTGQMAGTTLCVLYFGNLPPLEVMPMCGMVEKVRLAAILQAL